MEAITPILLVALAVTLFILKYMDAKQRACLKEENQRLLQEIERLKRERA